jgi:hypothetical protein
MPGIICNVCRTEITNPTEASKNRSYRIKANGHDLPIQKKHDACDVEYAAEKTGLEKIS